MAKIHKNKEIEQKLQLLIENQTKIISERKQNYVKIFKLETAQLEVGRESPIYINVENYTLTNKEIGERSYRDFDRPFTNWFPKIKKRELN